ncbi:MAG TPA: tetratricopeptide repeat protein [Terriglobales bacterium]|nr:tetratricopeptide repeat protein [Terriglobales bacterium]
MKRNFLYLLAISVVALLFASPAFAQTATVHGECKDAQGNPITDAQVTWHNDDNGRQYKLKTDKHGKYFSLGIDPGTYTVSLTKDGKDLDQPVKNYHVGADEYNLDFDVKKDQQAAVEQTAKEKGISAEQLKQMQEQNAKIEAHNKSITAVNEKLKAASAAEEANPPNYDTAIASLTEATQMAPDEDLVWFRLGKANLDSTKTVTDSAEKTKRYAEAYNDIQKAIDLEKSKNAPAGAAAPANGQAGQANGQAAPPPQNNKNPAQSAQEEQKLAAYYDNFAAAAAKVGKNQDAANAYREAIQVDPAHAGHYYTNLGITLMNSGDSKGSAEAFDKAIAADPSNANAYYFKGQSLFAGVTTDSSGKMSAPDGTAEALNKYLELQPNGPYSQSAKDMLAALGSKVETSYGTTKKKPK